MLQNEYSLAKFGFDTAENEPSTVYRSITINNEVRVSLADVTVLGKVKSHVPVNIFTGTPISHGDVSIQSRLRCKRYPATSPGS